GAPGEDQEKLAVVREVGPVVLFGAAGLDDDEVLCGGGHTRKVQWKFSPVLYWGFALSGSRFAPPRLRLRFARRRHPSSARRGIIGFRRAMRANVRRSVPRRNIPVLVALHADGGELL